MIEVFQNNWRPISLQPTIYKIYAAILARRLGSWAMDEEKICKSQKGFLPFEGCLEHSFLLRSVFEDSKRRRKNVRIVWLDLKNAFGSAPHHVMWDMMKRLDVPDYFRNICEEIYTGSTQRIRTKDGYTDDIPVLRGIKQGCPLSPLLFNLLLEGILPKLNQMNGGYRFKNGSVVKVLAYADDLCIMSHQKESLQEMLDELCKFFEWAGLSLNPSKCGAFSMINNVKRKYVEPFQPKIYNALIPALKWEDHYKYLGVQAGRQRSGSMNDLSNSMLADAKKIMDSPLTDWQKVDASTLLTRILAKPLS